jgi:hypothetical protein
VSSIVHGRSCTQDSDCVAVITGSVCDSCCPNDAISYIPEGPYTKSFDQQRRRCEFPGTINRCACLHSAFEVACIQHTCHLASNVAARP